MALWPTPDGREIWGLPSKLSPVRRWEIVEDSESGVTGLQPLEVTTFPREILPWRSPRGYEVTDDGWVLSPTKKRLLWLPHHWRSEEQFMTWSGRFLGLRYLSLPEVVIIEFFE